MMTTENPVSLAAKTGRGGDVSMYQYNNTAPAKGQGNSIDLIKAAMDYLKGRMSVIPVHPKTKKPTLPAWTPFKETAMSLEIAGKTSWPGIGIIAGKVSQNLECIDFDYKAELFDSWSEIVEIEAPGLIDKLLRQKTQNGGKHILYRCPEVEIPGNKKLAEGKIAVTGPGEHDFQGKSHRAFNEAGNWYILPCYIETRGEGGYFLASPTPGYEILNGSFSDIPEITLQERYILLRAAKALDLNAKPFKEPNYKSNGDRPGDSYNARGDVRSLLSKHGWKMAGSKGDFEHYTRPGKDKGVSASLINGKIFNVFTSNAYPLEDNKAYSPFSLYAAFEHNGDHEEAARDLRKLGFGNNQNQGSLSSQPFDKVPEPLPLEREIEKADPYPLDALGEIIGNAARIMNKVIQAPDGLCAHAVLGFATHSIQGAANVNIDGRIIPLNEFFLSIGSRSARKTECDSKAGQLHKNFQKQLLAEYQNNRSAYLDEKEVYAEEKKKILTDKKKPLSEKNTALEELRRHEPKGPYEPLIIFSDPTIEGIHGLFLRGTPSKYLCADEGGQVSGGHSMTAEKKTYTATTYSKYWDGAPIDRVRGGDGASVLYGRRLSVHLMMQDKIAAEFFNDEIMRNQGLLSRFLCSYPESLAGQRHYQAWDVSDTTEMQRYYQQIQRNLEEPLPLRVDEKTGDFLNELEPRTVTLDDDAKQALINAYEAIEVESGKGREFESIEGFAGKAANHIIRLAGIMALFDDITRKTISKSHIDNAITLMEYYLNERLRLTKMAEPNLELEQAKMLLKWIKDKRLKGVTLPDVYQLGPSRIRNKNQAQTSVRILQNHHWLIKKDDGGISQLTGKKSNEAYEVNDGEI